jgi:hypothetical protein
VDVVNVCIVLSLAFRIWGRRKRGASRIKGAEFQSETLPSVAFGCDLSQHAAPVRQLCVRDIRPSIGGPRADPSALPRQTPGTTRPTYEAPLRPPRAMIPFRSQGSLIFGVNALTYINPL